MISDFITWALLLGQGVLIAMYFTDIGWGYFRSLETRAETWSFLGALFFASGIVGLIGHEVVARWLHRRRSDDEQT